MAPADRLAAGKIGLLGSLYLAQGLPFGFFSQALPVMMRRQGWSLGSIGLSSLLAAPWALKFAWAPLVDRLGSARFGRRRSWIVPLQLASVLCLGVMALAASADRMNTLLAAVFMINTLAATQDIATDGLAVDILSPVERGLGNGVQVAGYRVGMIVGGGALLVALGAVGWRATFAIMALAIGASTVPILLYREPRSDRERRDRRPRARSHFLRRRGAGRILALVVSYKAGDHFAAGMLRPFLADRGISLAEIGVLLGTVGFVAGLAGAVAGGALVNRVGRRQSLILFGALQALTIGGYALLAATDRPSLLLYTLCAAEHLAGGMATAALFTCMMDWCSPDSAATDYTVQASAVVLASGAAAALSGFSAQAVGYLNHFALASGLGLAAVAAAWALFPQPPIRAPGREVEPCA